MPFLGIGMFYLLFAGGSLFLCGIFSAFIVFICIPLLKKFRSIEQTEPPPSLMKRIVLCALLTFGSSSLVIGGGTYLFCIFLNAEPDNSIENNSGLIELPLNGKITNVRHGYWAGDFTVEFTIESDEPPENILKSVWALNQEKLKGFSDYQFKESPHEIGIYCHGVAHMSIEYDPKRGVYIFEHYFES